MALGSFTVIGSVCLRTADLTWREADGQIVVLDLRSSCFLELNRSGSLLWKQLVEGPVPLGQLADLLVTNHGIDVEMAEQDAEKFVRMLREAELLEG